MTINVLTTVRDVAIELPRATRLFEKLKIDYCCGGDTPLTDACASAGVELNDVMRMIQEAETSELNSVGVIDFQKASLTELIKHILDQHHVYTKEEMVRLGVLIAKVIGAHGANHSELLAVGHLFQQLCDDLTPHMFKEEQVLFPYILKMESAALTKGMAPFAPFGTVNNPVRMMMTEHEAVGDILRELRTLTADYAVPADGCISYQTLYAGLDAFEKDLHQHIHLENNILFPRAIAMEGTPVID